jgi:RNA polymerase-interacting CarD/CdnL/TRCF family regulator
MKKEKKDKLLPKIPSILEKLIIKKIKEMMDIELNSLEDIDTIKHLFDDLYKFFRKPTTRHETYSKFYAYVTVKPVFSVGKIRKLFKNLDTALLYEILEFLEFLGVVEYVESLPIGGRSARVWKIPLKEDQHEFLLSQLRGYYNLKSADRLVEQRNTYPPKPDPKDKAIDKAVQKGLDMVAEEEIVKPIKTTLNAKRSKEKQEWKDKTQEEKDRKFQEDLDKAKQLALAGSQTYQLACDREQDLLKQLQEKNK